tara:strand:+ start:237 stop:389 length:153 start_codon:yes stop_codon:yes gene_type:complete
VGGYWVAQPLNNKTVVERTESRPNFDKIYALYVMVKKVNMKNTMLVQEQQ